MVAGREVGNHLGLLLKVLLGLVIELIGQVEVFGVVVCGRLRVVHVALFDVRRFEQKRCELQVDIGLFTAPSHIRLAVPRLYVLLFHRNRSAYLETKIEN